MNATNLEVVKSHRHCRSALTAVVYSPSVTVTGTDGSASGGDLLAVGSEEGTVDVYRVAGAGSTSGDNASSGYKRLSRGALAGGTPVRSIDWAVGGTTGAVVHVAGGGGVHHFDATTGRKVRIAQALLCLHLADRFRCPLPAARLDGGARFGRDCHRLIALWPARGGPSWQRRRRRALRVHLRRYESHSHALTRTRRTDDPIPE